MPSRNNPNVPTSQKRKSSRRKVQKRNAAAASTSSSLLKPKLNRSKNPRGTAPSSVLYPTAGPAAPLSGKKARKVDRAVMRERRRRMEELMKKEGEVVMTDAPRTTKPKTSTSESKAENSNERNLLTAETMDIDIS